MSLLELERDIRGCSRCTLCRYVPLPQTKSWRFAKVCPSTDRYGFHAYSGSGKMITGLSLMEKRSELNDDVADIINKCQLCGACQVSCQAYRDDIDLNDVLLELRAKCVEEGFVTPEHLDMLESLKRQDNTQGKLKADRGKWAEGLDIPNINEQRVDVLFHTGCMYSYDESLRDTIRGIAGLLIESGVNFGIAGNDEACCGGRAFEIGFQGEMKKFAEDMAGRIKASGARTIVTPCSDCFSTFFHLYHQYGMRIEAEVLHITEFYSRMIQEGRMKPSRSIPMKVTYHDPCHLGRRGEPYKEGWSGDDKLMRPAEFKQSGQDGIYDAPRDIIRSLPGAELVEMERIREFSWCCGAGGGVLEAYPDFAEWTAGDRIEEAKATGAEAIVTACPRCMYMLKTSIDEMGETMKVYDVIELLRLSMGVN